MLPSSSASKSRDAEGSYRLAGAAAEPNNAVVLSLLVFIGVFRKLDPPPPEEVRRP